jgi:hypothetical protein
VISELGKTVLHADYQRMVRMIQMTREHTKKETGPSLLP